MPGKIVSKNELAALWDKTPKTLTIWQNQGMPHVKGANPGDENQYDTAECTNWRILRESGKVDPNAEKSALYREQAEKARRENARERGEVMTTEEVQAVNEVQVAVIRQAVRVAEMSEVERAKIFKRIEEYAALDYEDARKRIAEETE